MNDYLNQEINLQTMLPPTVKELKEMKEIARVESDNFNAVRLKLIELFSTRFVNETNETGISLWERMLNIKPASDDSLKFRRTRVLARIQSNYPYTMRYLKSLLRSILGENDFEVTLDIVQEHLDVLVRFESGLSAKQQVRFYRELSDLLDRVVPLNLGIGMTNRRTVEMSLNFGAFISERKKVTLNPVRFKLPTLHMTKYRLGVISTYNKTTIKAVV